jgi:hypothetical protein
MPPPPPPLAGSAEALAATSSLPPHPAPPHAPASCFSFDPFSSSFSLLGGPNDGSSLLGISDLSLLLPNLPTSTGAGAPNPGGLSGGSLHVQLLGGFNDPGITRDAFDSLLGMAAGESLLGFSLPPPPLRGTGATGGLRTFWGRSLFSLCVCVYMTHIM